MKSCHGKAQQRLMSKKRGEDTELSELIFPQDVMVKGAVPEGRLHQN